MNTNSFKEYSFANHGEVYRAVDEVCHAHGIKYYLIGANARDVALYNAGQKPSRGTKDIDFAVMLPDMDAYEELKEQILANFERF